MLRKIFKCKSSINESFFRDNLQAHEHLWILSIFAKNDYALHSSYKTTKNNVADYISQLKSAIW